MIFSLTRLAFSGCGRWAASYIADLNTLRWKILVYRRSLQPLKDISCFNQITGVALIWVMPLIRQTQSALSVVIGRRLGSPLQPREYPAN